MMLHRLLNGLRKLICDTVGVALALQTGLPIPWLPA
jgi:hypothetical protein